MLQPHYSQINSSTNAEQTHCKDKKIEPVG